MATYVIGPGAWTSGSALHPHAGNNALHPHLSGSSGLHPHPLGNSPWHPHQTVNTALHPHQAVNTALHPHLLGQHSELGPLNGAQHPHVRPLRTMFWHGVDPAAAHLGGPQALLAQALERTHARIVRPSDPGSSADPRLPAGHKGQMQTAAGAVDIADPLWRWGSEFRVHAVVADLAWRLRVKGHVLELTEKGATSLDLQKCVTLTPKEIRSQIDKVQRAAVEREDRLPEILSQSDDFRVFFRVLLGLDAVASPLLGELLAAAWQWATPLVMALKNNVAALRPVQLAPSVMPVIATPAHGSLPSGHATLAALTAEILSQLLFDGEPDHLRVKQMDRLARRIAFNRVVAGVHFPIDSAAGYALGLQLAGHFVGWAQNKPGFKEHALDPKDFKGLSETSKKVMPEKKKRSDGESAPLGLLWDAATREAKRGGL